MSVDRKINLQYSNTVFTLVNNITKDYIMKNALFALLLAVSLNASAGPNTPASIAFEYEHENIEGTGNDLNSFSVIPGYTFSNGIKLDAKLTGKQADDSNTTSVAFEPRVKYMVPLTSALSVGGRVSVGETLQDSGDYAFYTLEPTVEYAINKQWTVNTSVKYKDSFGDKGTESTTLYVGAGYKVSDTHTVSAKAYTRNAAGDVADSQGVEVNYAIAF
jgi:hypothetical protein